MTDATGADPIPDADTAPGPRLSDAPLVVITRFSYLGKSGWKSDASRDAELLFAPERLRLRMNLFRSITLPSLAAQTDQSFTHVILTSNRLPTGPMEELQAACAAAYPDASRFAILAERPGPAATHLRRHFQKVITGPLVAQAVLDDDDGLAVDFVFELRQRLAALDAAGRATGPGRFAFVSFQNGYGCEFGLSDAGPATASLYAHRYPYINCGLTMVAGPGEANILGIRHRKTPLLHDPVLVRGNRMFLRSVHGTNDSRVARTGRWKPVDPWRENEDIRSRFPWLLDPGAFWNQG